MTTPSDKMTVRECLERIVTKLCTDKTLCDLEICDGECYKDIDDCLASIREIVYGELEDKIRAIICDTTRETAGLNQVKHCKDGFGFTCPYKIACAQHIADFRSAMERVFKGE